MSLEYKAEPGVACNLSIQETEAGFQIQLQPELHGDCLKMLPPSKIMRQTSVVFPPFVLVLHWHSYEKYVTEHCN